MNNFINIYVLILLLIVFKITYGGLDNSILKLDEQVQIPCNDNISCTELGLTECKNGICQFDSNLTKINIGLKVSKVGQNCSQLIHCNIENSVCNEKEHCVCIEEYVVSANQRKCLKVSNFIDQPCEEAHQCTIPKSICQDDKCQCSSYTHLHNGKCYESVELGGPCEVNEDCLNTKFSICHDNVCTCNNGYVQSMKTSECLIEANNILSNCMENVQCISSLGYGSTCSDDGICKCLEFYHFIENENKCVLNTPLGEPCGTHDDCHQPGNDRNHLECVIGVCKCKSSYYDYKGYYCVLSSSRRRTTFNILYYVFSCVISHLTFYIIMH